MQPSQLVSVLFSPPAVALGVTLLAFAVLWVISLRGRDCGIVDLYWAAVFPVIGWLELALGPPPQMSQILFMTLVTLWAARLGTHLAIRHLQSEAEDPRYRAMRDQNGDAWPMRSFWMVFMVQAVVLWLVAAPIHFAMAPGAGDAPPAVVALAIALFGAGFVVESVADSALAAFRRVPENRGRLLTTGIFAWSRHPNYFGEALLWWGLGILAWGMTGQILTLAGPALLTLLLIKVSGIPPLEAHLSARPGFSAYAAQVPAFVPRPPKSAGSEPAARDA